MEVETKIDVLNVYLEMGWDVNGLLEIIKSSADPRLPQSEREK